MKKRTCKHKAIAKGKGERYWRCIFCGQKVADPVQSTDKKIKVIKTLKNQLKKNYDLF